MDVEPDSVPWPMVADSHAIVGILGAGQWLDPP